MAHGAHKVWFFLRKFPTPMPSSHLLLLLLLLHFPLLLLSLPFSSPSISSSSSSIFFSLLCHNSENVLMYSKHHAKCLYESFCWILITSPPCHLHFTKKETKIHGDSALAQASQSSPEPTRQYSVLKHFTASRSLCKSCANESFPSKIHTWTST